MPGYVTYRKFEVGAEATDARADSPGSDEPKELAPEMSLLPCPNFSISPRSGRASEDCKVGYVPSITPGPARREVACLSIAEIGLL